MTQLFTYLTLIISTLVQTSFELDSSHTSNNDNESNTLAENTVLLSLDSSPVTIVTPPGNNNFDVHGFAKHGFGKHGSSAPYIFDSNSNDKTNQNNKNMEKNDNREKHSHNNNNKNDNNPYEHESMINSYKHFHYYNGKYFGVSNFPSTVANFAIEIGQNQSIQFNRAMDIGCAVGRISFELSQYFDFVQGIDFSHEMIDVAKSVQKNNDIVWYMPNEGDIYDKFETNIETIFSNQNRDINNNNNNINVDNINFCQNDALNLDSKYDNFNLIIASNLIDRLSNPRKFLIDIKDRLINDNSVLIICTPYTWLEQYTSKSEWMGGTYDKNENGIVTPVFGSDTMKDILLQWFDLIKEKNIEMVFRETKWEYVHSISHCTAWSKRDD